ncbi:ParA family protein [Pseudoflavonifractor phocaeensis]|uniref:ParA family protein n=1 Tax=Pseudoflavonifractor phocaeensis TaxID=1870988 RepID=UPI00195A2273|nr:ParA family protein [Pseudoflavonifractor phocaeensis]MBM6926941.1 ParA family protein [Pseudoflavonifractor phocaeensis]
MKTFAIVNRKGGVGKTTTAVNLAYVLATGCRLRVLLVDADGQANATQILLPPGEYAGLGALLRGYACCWDELVIPTDVDGLHVLPAAEDLGALDLEAAGGDRSRCYRAVRDMREALEEDGAYDVMVIDCPPNLSAACVAAILASDSVIIPVLSDACSATGVGDLVEQIASLRSLHPALRVAGVLVNQWHRSPVVEVSVAYLREEGMVPVYDTVIRRTDKVPESSWARMAVQQWSPFCSAARDYRAWVAELAAKEGIKYGQA